jgi:hypothetical protein
MKTVYYTLVLRCVEETALRERKPANRLLRHPQGEGMVPLSIHDTRGSGEKGLSFKMGG